MPMNFARRIPLILFLAALFIGGADTLAFAERGIYEVVASNNVSQNMTTFRVFADTELDARENVSLNGWKIIRVTRLDPPVKQDIQLKLETEKTDKPKFAVDTPVQLPEEEKAQEKQQAAALTPKSDKLKQLYTVYFSLGAVNPILSKEDREALLKLPKNDRYILFGNTDSVPVGTTNDYENNFDLSLQRADSVKKIMIELAEIPEANLTAIGVGPLYPLAQNPEEGQPKNRRVEIYGYR